MALVSNLFKNKVYLLAQPKKVFDLEKGIIAEIFEEQNLGMIRSIDFVDANEGNDLFLVSAGNDEFYVKLSFKDSSKLKKEFELLQKNVRLKTATFPIAHGQLQKFNLEYEVLAKIPFPNLFDYGWAALHSSLEAVPYFAANFHDFQTVENLPNSDEYLKFYLDFDILKVPDFQVDWIENHQRIKNIVKEQVLELQKIIKNILKETSLKNEVICHGDLRASNVLVGTDGLKAINLEKSYFGDRCFDFACMKYVFYYSVQQDIKLWQKYCELTSTEFRVSEYRKYQDLAGYFALLKIMVNYLTEVYVLKGCKQNRVLQCAIDLSKNFNAFVNLPEFNSKLKPIAEFFVESVI